MWQELKKPVEKSRSLCSRQMKLRRWILIEKGVAGFESAHRNTQWYVDIQSTLR